MAQVAIPAVALSGPPGLASTANSEIALQLIHNPGQDGSDKRSIHDDDVSPPVNPHVYVTPTYLPRRRAILVIGILSGTNFLSSMSTGFLTVGLPRMAVEVGVPDHLLLWPASVYTLTCGSCLLLAGAIADVVGNRKVNLVGCFLIGIFLFALGLSQTGIQLIMFRAMQGIAASLCFPTCVSIVANSVPSGRARNIGFSCLGIAQPLGFSLGMVMEGLILDNVGWRFGFHLCGGLTIMLFVISVWCLPQDMVKEGSKVTRLKKEIDWIGAGIISTALGLFSYVLAVMTNNLSNMKSPGNIVMLTISLALIPVFIMWERRKEKSQKQALIPNSLWKNAVFTSICLMILFSYAVVNSMELFCSLFFQEVQELSALQTSIRIIPSLIVGAIAQLCTGLLIHRTSAFTLVLTSLIISSAGPLLMALINVKWPYWYDAFFAQLVSPVSADILFTVGLLVVSDVFPTHMQALAGAVFNTVAQFGTSIGITFMAIISSYATKHSKFTDKSSPAALMVGYRASFWAAFIWMGVACVIGGFGLRKIGRIGLKRD
ncbi:hypothetical protein H072_9687 [Dactylellina haptotyla CBS 200.50]|uniref:Major facilitator superfamily (MFS) profile domain-containing protein n=1 Tax=Dactylellina haptotyla (strain CBS 200.50) TaxID=1284197 RepID=S8BNH1_DACHA|nr:hypothetical protein H072_9687 [Dactylellina haptotyla CBS 200.50]